MRLKQLRISGFKSFADTTVIEFPGAVAGIVGPNGCGKSNVIDAIRWVLGEARVSELRGSSSMSELIFAGSANRPASSRASVELVLDNTDGSVAGAWGRYAELSVKRIMTRDGSNAYLINNQQVRKRDVQDIFLGTGLGPRSYAIISQGMITNFIRAKPEELRVYLEEAAGVSKYKERRRETETALNATRNNLEKVSYLQETKRSEVERLEAEAEVAAKWKALNDEKLEAELLWFFLQERDAAGAVDKINARIAKREADLIEGRGEVQRITLEIENLKNEAQQKRAEADKAREAAWQANSRVSEIEGNIKRILAQKDSLAREIESAVQTLARRKTDKANAAARIKELSERAQALELEAQEAADMAQAAQEETEARRLEFEEKKAASDAARTKAAEVQRKSEVLNVELQALFREAADVRERIEALEAEERETQAPDEARFEELAAVIEERRAEAEEAVAQAEAVNETVTAAKEKLEAARVQKDESAQKLARISAHLQALQSVQQKAQAEGKLPAWLEKMGLDKLPRLFESLEVDDGWAVAIEAVLSVRASAIEMGVLDRASGFTFDPPPARLVFYSGAGKAQGAAQEGDLLLTRVRSTIPAVNAALEVWLSGVKCAANLEEALASRGNLAVGERIVTPEGHIVDAASVVFWAEENESAGMMARAAEINTLTQTEADLRAQSEEFSQNVLACSGQLQQEENRLREQNARTSEISRALHAVEVEYSALSAAVAAWRERSRRVAGESAELKRRAEELAARCEEREAQYENLEGELSEVQQAAANAEEAMREAGNKLSGLEESVRTLVSKEQLLKVEAKNMLARVQDAREQEAGADEEIELLAASMEELAAKREGLDETAEREGLGKVLKELDEKNAAHKEAEEISRKAEETLEAARQKASDLNASQTPLLQEISDLKVKRESWTTQSQAFTQRLNEAHADRVRLGAKVEEENLKSNALKNRVWELSEAIAELGAVNHAALENLTESRRAMEETERQVADLEEAIANLEATIRKIDAETRDLLRTTFNEVNRNFSEMFTGLFGGGSAQLKMSGEEILEAGIEVVAHPPGKRNDSVKLLSGGEQAMTATALVFAIFKLNPAPFCLLDEVDAPLDEANQDRLARRILQMSANTQFMMITHHRVTMEHLKTLVGVTMKEPGVSRVVSVDVAGATAAGMVQS